jgi:dynein heavy chain
LIILDVHAQTIVDGFVRDSIMSAKEFEWESQLRFYWDFHKDDIEIRQCTGVFDYCYEYQGLNGRLVITPLTDRCVMTLTTALTFKMGGAPAGPAGTGKTETVKDLAKGIALRCVVTNCGETLDYVAMGFIFSGLIQTGFWGCFDEFNRINVEVLSVVSAQIKTVQNGLLANKHKIVFLENEMRLIHTIGIYITMNPGYAGRSELPDNLKALFRPVTMVVPDLLLICENMLMSEGFTSAKVLAKKMTVLYKLAKEQLSKQYHYDFQLRALKSVLVMAGSLKRQYADLPEDIVLMRALRDMNMPKFVFDDVPLFHGLIQDLFPGLRAERVGFENLKEIIIKNMDDMGFKHAEEEKFYDQVNKMIQLYETMQTRHTTMVVGPTGAGKSVILKELAKALAEELEMPVKIDTINPKMITLNELYGVLDPDSRDWTDGLLSKIFKECNRPRTEEDKSEIRWILYDGDVDAVWVENMNSVMDDNKILTLANGDRIRLQKWCAMLFEVFDLQYASPATISRCGMVYVDPKNLGYRPYYSNWLRKKTTAYGETVSDSLKELFQKYVPALIDRVFEGVAGDEIVAPMEFITPRTDLNVVQQLCHLIDAIFPDPENNPPQDVVEIEKLYLFCLVWSIGGSLVAEDREKFNVFITQVSQTLLPPNLYDNFYDASANNLDLWEKKVSQYEAPADKKFASILVPTVDTTRYSWLLNSLLVNKRPVMFCGHSGTAKTVTVFSAFRQLDQDAYMFLNVNFSSRTTSRNF